MISAIAIPYLRFMVSIGPSPSPIIDIRNRSLKNYEGLLLFLPLGVNFIP